MTTPSTRIAFAARRMVPRLPGLEGRSKTTTSGRCPSWIRSRSSAGISTKASSSDVSFLSLSFSSNAWGITRWRSAVDEFRIAVAQFDRCRSLEWMKVVIVQPHLIHRSMALTFLAIAPQNFDVLKVVVLRPNLDVLGSHDETPGGLARPKPTGNVLLALRLGHTCVWLSAIPAAAQTSGDSVGVN